MKRLFIINIISVISGNANANNNNNNLINTTGDYYFDKEEMKEVHRILELSKDQVFEKRQIKQ